MSALIGNAIETGEQVRIGDIERRSGLYILGRSGMGKTDLLLNLMAKDIEAGHGVFFLDPHGRAIEKLLQRGDLARLHSDDLLIFDPTDKTHSFGINLFNCRDVTNWDEYNASYNRTRWALFRLFEEQELGDKP